MTNSAKNFLVVTIAMLGWASDNALAQGRLTDINVVTVALTLQSQGSHSDNGTVSIYKSPVIRRMNTKDLLNQLARDEVALTNYPSTSFPSGAKLAVNSTNGAMVVVDGGNQLLVDVSSIVSFSAGTNDVVTGRVSDATGLALAKTTELIYVRLNFDDTFIPGSTNFVNGNLSFFVDGVDTVKTTDSVPGQAGNYHESTTDAVKTSAGEGQSNGTQFMVTGSIQGSRSANLNNNPAN